DDGVKFGSRGSKLVKEGVKSLTQAQRVRSKGSYSKKMKKGSTKLKTERTISRTTNTDLESKFIKKSKANLRKRTMRKNIDKSQAKRSVSAIAKRSGVAIKNTFNAMKNVTAALFKRMMGTK